MRIEEHFVLAFIEIDLSFGTRCFFDSNGRTTMPRKAFSLRTGVTRRQLFPDAIYFIEREF